MANGPPRPGSAVHPYVGPGGEVPSGRCGTLAGQPTCRSGGGLMDADRLPPIGVSLSADVEFREGRPKPYRARARWVDPVTRQRPSKSESFATPEAAQAWIDAMHQAARGGVDPTAANLRLADYGEA